jgi:hypothetical protein
MMCVSGVRRHHLSEDLEQVGRDDAWNTAKWHDDGDSKHGEFDAGRCCGVAGATDDEESR